MQFVRVADENRTVFCAVREDGALVNLTATAAAPADFLGLYQMATARGMGPTQFARQLLDEASPLPWTFSDVDVAPASGAHLTLPFVPPEVWGAAFTYLKSGGSYEDPYVRERLAERPVIFFKATPNRYVGPNEAVGSRSDCTAMIPEPELGLILSEKGETIGYTIVNDVSSRDLPRENPLYVTYSKVFDRCVSFGPVVLGADELPDATNLDVTCRVTRAGRLIWDETGNTGRMYRTFEQLIDATIAHNSVPLGTLLATGTALSPPQDMHIVEGDLLEVEISGLGCLRNPVVAV